jgi:hypothetical protein
MKRRQLLQSVAIGTAIAAWPAWIRRAFAAETCKPGQEDRDFLTLMAAYHRARSAGKPLLVFVVPAGRANWWEFGEYFGTFINHAPAQTMALLTLAEVVCATPRSIEQLVPEAKVDAFNTLLALIETDSVPGKVRTVSVTRLLEGQLSDPAHPEPYDPERFHQQVSTRITRIGTFVRELLAPNDAALTARVAQTRAAQQPEMLAEVEERLARGLIPLPETILPAASFLHASANHAAQARRLQLVEALASEAERNLRSGRIAGSRWAAQYGCGAAIEGESEAPGPACGMGSVPPLSQRFLWFFSDKDRAQ